MGSTDGYVEVCLLPWSDKVEKTKTIKNSANPVWNQSFQFKVTKCFVKLNMFATSVSDPWGRNWPADALHAAL